MRTYRLIGVAALVAGGLLLTTTPAHAVVDPIVTLNCLLGGATAAGGLVNPATLIDPATLIEPATLIPAELPFFSCLTAP